MPDVKDLTLLGNSKRSLPSSPDEAQIEVFPNQFAHRKYQIELDCPEFSSLCPVTGQPDTARITITYIPGKVCLETKSVKFYLASYRNHPAFNEEVVNRLLTDLVAACEPVSMMVKGKFGSRGGISLTVAAQYPEAE